jgi:hypothetical protein
MTKAARLVRGSRAGLLSIAVAAMLLLAGCGGGDAVVGGEGTSPERTRGDAASPSASMRDMSSPGMNEGDMAEMSADAPRVPPVFGYYGGEEVFFIHTETSDPDIASTLEEMMGSPVPVVESLAEMPEAARSAVYVFTNGVVPDGTSSGPLGFAPDVFDTAPGDEEYTPLREVMLVTWSAEADARVLTSEQEVLDAEAAGELDIEDTGIVVNMPLLTWPGGQR